MHALRLKVGGWIGIQLGIVVDEVEIQVAMLYVFDVRGKIPIGIPVQANSSPLAALCVDEGQMDCPALRRPNAEDCAIRQQSDAEVRGLFTSGRHPQLARPLRLHSFSANLEALFVPGVAKLLFLSSDADGNLRRYCLSEFLNAGTNRY